MTKEQEIIIAQMFKANATYREIQAATDIPAASCASVIRRKYPHLSALRAMERKSTYDKTSKKVADSLEIPQYQADAVYSELKERYDRKKFRCHKKGEEFSITLESLGFPLVCPMLGIPLDYYAPPKADNSPTFDRKDNTKGYVPGNVFIVSWRANRMKSDGTAHEHKLIAEWMSKDV